MNIDENIIAHTVDYIEKHLDSSIDLEQIAMVSGYSKFHLNRIFCERTGITIHKYIRMRRLTKAAKQLALSTIPIIDIACDANYSTQQAFTLAFRQVYGCSPMIYRQNGVYLPVQTALNIVSGHRTCEGEVMAA